MVDGVYALPTNDSRALGFGGARKTDNDLVARVRVALEDIADAGVRVSFPIVAERVGVAKSTLYRNRDVVRMVEVARDASRSLPRRQDVDARELVALREEVAMLRADNERLRGLLLGSQRESKVEHFFVYLPQAA